MSSARLPGKVLMPLAGRPIVDWVFRAAQESTEIDDVILATSNHRSDDIIADYASERGITTVRGDLDDVLNRFNQALDSEPADAVVRLTADCPLLDPALIDAVVSVWRHNQQTDYVASTLHRSLPRGLDVECVRAETLRTLRAIATGHDRIHVTSRLYAPNSEFSQLGLVTAPSRAHYRLTVDTELDLQALNRVTALTGDRSTPWRDIVALLDRHPDIPAINTSVIQKALSEG